MIFEQKDAAQLFSSNNRPEAKTITVRKSMVKMNSRYARCKACKTTKKNRLQINPSTYPNSTKKPKSRGNNSWEGLKGKMKNFSVIKTIITNNSNIGMSKVHKAIKTNLRKKFANCHK